MPYRAFTGSRYRFIAFGWRCIKAIKEMIQYTIEGASTFFSCTTAQPH